MIRVTTWLAGLALLAIPGIASAQTSFYGMLTCDAVGARSTAVAKVDATASDAAAKGNGGSKNGPAGKNGGAFEKGADGERGRPKKGNGGQNTANDGNGSAANGARGVAASSAISSAATAAAQEKCSWTLPLQIGNDTATDGLNTFNSNITGNLSNDTGSHTSNTNNSDRFTLSFTGTSVLDGGQTRSRQGTWKFTGGTGSLKGITGDGTYTGIARAAGGMSYDLEGNYQLPSAIPAVPPAAGTSVPGGSSSTKPVS